MKKLLHVIESLEFGGAEKVVLNLANGMTDDFQVSIVMTKREGPLMSQASPKVSLHCLHGNEGNDKAVVTQLVEYISQNQIDILHIHNWSVYLECIAAVRKLHKVAPNLASNLKVIHTIHGPYIQYSNHWLARLKKMARHWLEKAASRYVDFHVGVSDAIAQFLIEEKTFDPNKVVRIHNGITATDLKVGSFSPPLKIIAVGRLAKVKNHQLMLSAFKRVREQCEVSLTLVGDGPEMANIQAQIQSLGLENSVNLLGFQTDVISILVNHHLFWVTSDYEGISIAVLEAMSLSMPIVSSHVGGMPETIEHGLNGLLVESTVEAMADAILMLANNPQSMQKMGEHSLRLFNQKFNQEKVLDDYRKLYLA